MNETPAGLCQCGCGERTTVYKGTPRQFISGHNPRSSPVEYLEEDRGFATPCWTWQRNKNQKGYGLAWRDGRCGVIHRWYYEQARGPIPEGLQLDHLCRNRACVNPDHLEPVTNAENQRRAVTTKLTADDVRAIRAVEGVSQSEIGQRYGIAQCTVSAIKRRKLWAEV